MTKGRKLRLARLAAILAALFVFVQAAHAGGHVTGATPADPPCAMCSAASDALAPATDATPRFAAVHDLDAPGGAPLRAAAPLPRRSRAPPALG